MAIIARQHRELPDLTQQDLLSIVYLVKLEDSDLAISFWKKAISQDVSDDQVSDIVHLGFQLGLDVGEDLKPLLARMKELGDSRQGGVTLLDLQELISFFKQRREHIEEMKDVYDQGILPIHIISKELNGSLLELFHYCLSENEKAPDPRNQFYLLARHGGRKVDFDLSERPQRRLNLDNHCRSFGCSFGYFI